MHFLCKLEDKVIFVEEGGKQEDVWRLEESEKLEKSNSGIKRMNWPG